VDGLLRHHSVCQFIQILEKTFSDTSITIKSTPPAKPFSVPTGVSVPPLLASAEELDGVDSTTIELQDLKKTTDAPPSISKGETSTFVSDSGEIIEIVDGSSVKTEEKQKAKIKKEFVFGKNFENNIIVLSEKYYFAEVIINDFKMYHEKVVELYGSSSSTPSSSFNPRVSNSFSDNSFVFRNSHQKHITQRMRVFGLLFSAGKYPLTFGLLEDFWNITAVGVYCVCV
jgi:hypothetical protein